MQVQLHRKPYASGRHLHGAPGKCALGQKMAKRGCTVDLGYGGMPPSQSSVAAWRKSSYSNPSGNCVEMARLPSGRVAVRDSARPGGPALVFTRAQWAAFLRGFSEGRRPGRRP